MIFIKTLMNADQILNLRLGPNNNFMGLKISAFTLSKNLFQLLEKIAPSPPPHQKNKLSNSS